jgi:hypothetical protein
MKNRTPPSQRRADRELADGLRKGTHLIIWNLRHYAKHHDAEMEPDEIRKRVSSGFKEALTLEAPRTKLLDVTTDPPIPERPQRLTARDERRRPRSAAGRRTRVPGTGGPERVPERAL